MKIAIHGRTFNESARPFVESLFNELSRKGIQVQLSRSLRTFLDENQIAHHTTLVYERPADLYDANWVMSMGGDGTLLETISHIGAREIPTIGVNMGRLGFLATVSPDKIAEMLNVVVRGDYKIDERTLVELESNSNYQNGYFFHDYGTYLSQWGISEFLLGRWFNRIHANRVDRLFIKLWWPCTGSAFPKFYHHSHQPPQPQRTPIGSRRQFCD